MQASGVIERQDMTISSFSDLTVQAPSDLQVRLWSRCVSNETGRRSTVYYLGIDQCELVSANHQHAPLPFYRGSEVTLTRLEGNWLKLSEVRCNSGQRIAGRSYWIDCFKRVQLESCKVFIAYDLPPSDLQVEEWVRSDRPQTTLSTCSLEEAWKESESFPSSHYTVLVYSQ